MDTVPSPWLGFLRGVFLANHLASTDNLTRTTKRQNTYQLKTINTQKVALIRNNTMKNYTKTIIDRAWFNCLYTTSGQETERVNSYNPKPSMGETLQNRMKTVIHNQLILYTLFHTAKVPDSTAVAENEWK